MLRGLQFSTDLLLRVLARDNALNLEGKPQGNLLQWQWSVISRHMPRPSKWSTLLVRADGKNYESAREMALKNRATYLCSLISHMFRPTEKIVVKSQLFWV